MKTANPAKKRLSSAKDLMNRGLISTESLSSITQTEENFSIGVSEHLVQHIEKHDSIRKQYIPDIQELNFTESESNDPIGDEAHTPVKGIVHRYPDRTLLKVTNACAVYCRYCFRREMIGPGSETLSKEELDNALNYIRKTPQIWEVILTGGDPLILSPDKLKRVFKALEEIDHIRIIRIHTRVPMADPMRICDEKIQLFKSMKKPVYCVLHVNHKQEITEDVRQLCQHLHAAGCTLLSQSVLLKNINDDAQILEELFRELIVNNIKPYYLHHPDKAKGTSHFRLSLKEGMVIYRQLLGKVSGICQPSYMLDIPGGHGKIPVNHSYIEEISEGSYSVQDYQGHTHIYEDN